MKKKILIVDDEPDIVISVSDFLTKHGYQTEVLYTGRSAISRARNNKYDLLILDIAMPYFNGFEVARTLTNQKIVFMTAYDFKKEEAIKFKNCAGFIQKPFDLKKLLNVVKKALDKQI
jgi:DNA-binding response OmpR family regulator